MGALLGEIVDATYARIGAMASAIVLYLNENDAGTGFYKLAQEQGWLSRTASADQKLDFWIGQMNAVYAYYGWRG